MSTRVLLGDVEVGEIRVAGPDRDQTEFTFLESYRDRYPQPVLSLNFIGKQTETFRRRQRLHPFFTNLLPEGALRRLIADSVGVKPGRELFLLNRIGGDLPGAVVAIPSDDEPNAHLDDGIEDEDVAAAAPSAPHAGDPASELHFSLAGMQLKFSMFENARRGMTLPMSGQGGKWIVKLPDPLHPDVPVNEWSMMRWAQAAGIRVPEIRLVEVSGLEGLPAELRFNEPLAFAVRRFDRPDDSSRVHVEDFAQVLGTYPTRTGKYGSTNYETIGRIILRVAGEEDAEEFIRRLVFNIASGNGDAHVKNWSLIYPDGVRPRLAPAYDLVFTAPYVKSENLALNLAGSKRFEDADVPAFRSWARAAGFDEGRTVRVVEAAVETIRAAWVAWRDQLPLTGVQRELLEAHWKRTALFR